MATDPTYTLSLLKEPQKIQYEHKTDNLSPSPPIYDKHQAVNSQATTSSERNLTKNDLYAVYGLIG
jgi:hypothetical protein